MVVFFTIHFCHLGINMYRVREGRFPKFVML